jgi:ABC-type nitrate/sulfonate/bicarbonate transport system substrate-binding protein
VKQINRTTRAAWLAECGAIGAAAVLGSAGRSAAQSTALKIGATPREPTAEGYYALNLGFFRKRGLDVAISVFNSGAAVAAAVVGGDVQIGNSNLLQLCEAYSHGVPLVLVAPAGIYDPRHPDALCVVAANSPIVSPKDLNGKVVAGASVGGQDQLSLSALVDKSGGDSSTVKFIEMPSRPPSCRSRNFLRPEAASGPSAIHQLPLRRWCSRQRGLRRALGSIKIKTLPAASSPPSTKPEIGRWPTRKRPHRSSKSPPDSTKRWRGSNSPAVST